jgi:hypothetical protein
MYGYIGIVLGVILAGGIYHREVKLSSKVASLSAVDSEALFDLPITKF